MNSKKNQLLIINTTACLMIKMHTSVYIYFSDSWIITSLITPHNPLLTLVKSLPLGSCITPLICLSLSAWLCVFFSLFSASVPLSTPRSKPPLPTHSVSHTYCLPARSLLLSDKQRALDCSYESDVCPSWSHPSLCRPHVRRTFFKELKRFSVKRKRWQKCI